VVAASNGRGDGSGGTEQRAPAAREASDDELDRLLSASTPLLARAFEAARAPATRE
jgi:hypothetical protein